MGKQYNMGCHKIRPIFIHVHKSTQILKLMTVMMTAVVFGYDVDDDDGDK
jgi:hypothetical protein